MSGLHDLRAPLNTHSIERCWSLTASAEKELNSLIAAVHELYGSTAAVHAGDYWVIELESVDNFSAEENPNWRMLTIAALSRLLAEGILSSRPSHAKSDVKLLTFTPSSQG